MRSTSTDAFSNACAKVDPDYGISAPLVTPWNNPDIRASEILEEHVRQASDEAIVWAQEQDLDKALRDHAALPTTAPGALPIWHLAALAVLGDVERLKSYQASFEAGDRLGFVNYVTKDYIDRAVAFAESGSLFHKSCRRQSRGCGWAGLSWIMLNIIISVMRISKS